MTQVGLLVEARLVQAERVDDIDDLLRVLVRTLVVAALGRRVGADVDVLAADGDLFAVGFVDGAVDLLEVVGVGDELVAGDDVLKVTVLACVFVQQVARIATG